MDPTEPEIPKDIKVEVYVARYLWMLAAEEAVRADEFRRQHPQAGGAPSALSAIIYAAMSAEAFINEAAACLYRDTNTPSSVTGARLWEAGQLVQSLDRDRASTLTKYLAFSTIIGGDVLKTGAEPFQGLRTLFSMRNDIVHPAPKDEPGYIAQFRQRGLTFNTNDDEPKLAGWVFQLQTPGVARWACRSASAVIKHIQDQWSKVASQCEWDRIHFDQWYFGWPELRTHHAHVWPK
jgi:hypothetical protein